MRKILDRNRQMRNIAKAATWKWEKATVHSIDGDRANIRLGNSPNLIRNVEVAGDISGLLPMSEVSIVWKNNRPVVIAGQPVGTISQTILQASSDVPASSGLVQWGNQMTDGTLSNRTTASNFSSCQAQLTPFRTMQVEGIIWDVYNADLYSLYWLYSLGITAVMNPLVIDEPVDAGGPHTFLFPEPIVLMPGVPYYFGLSKSVASLWKDWNAGAITFGDFMLNGVYYNTTNYLASYSAPIQLIYRTESAMLAVQNGGSSTTIIQGGGGTSGPHAATHEAGGEDLIHVTGLNGLLADPQTPLGHGASHQLGGSDLINVAGLSGKLADAQTPLAHKASHQAGGADALDLTGLTGMTAANVTTDTAAFNGILTAAENTVQKALDRLDDAIASAGSGDVTGPGFSVAGHAAVFGGATGKVIADAGFAPVLPNTLTNKSGQTAYAGDVAVFDAGNANAFKFTNFFLDLRVAGIVAETIANNASGRVNSLTGSVVTVNCDSAAISIGQFLVSSAVPGKGTSGGYFRAVGAFAIAMSSKAGGSTGTVSAMLIDNFRQAVSGSAGYALGGMTGATVIATAQKFNIASATWAGLSSADIASAKSSMASLTDRTSSVYVLGGGVNTATAENMPFATENTSTQASANLSSGRSELRGSASGTDRGFVCGGHEGSSSITKVDKITYATAVRSIGPALSSGRERQTTVADGTYGFVRGGISAAADKINFATDTLAAATGANLDAAMSYYTAFSIPASAGYNAFKRGVTVKSRKVVFATGLDANVASSPPTESALAFAVTDGLGLAWLSGSDTTPYTQSCKFDAATETYSTDSGANLVIGNCYGAQGSYATFS